MAGYLITNRGSSESRDRACSGYAKSRQRKTIVNRGTLLSDIISGILPKTDAVDMLVVKSQQPAAKIVRTTLTN